MKLDTGSRLVLAAVLSFPAWWFYGALGFLCAFAVINDVFRGQS